MLATSPSVFAACLLAAALSLASGCGHHTPRDPGSDGGQPDAGRRHVHRDAGARPGRVDAGFFCDGAPGFPGPPLLEVKHFSYDQGFAVGDFTGDGRPDLLFSAGALTVYPGLGNAAFGEPIVGVAAFGALSVADFDGDGNLDVASSAGHGAAVHVFRGRGDGSFEPAGTLLTDCDWLAVGDINHDGHPDLVTSSHGGVAPLLGHGDGTFGPPIFTGIGREVGKVTLADFNHDGLLDVAWRQGISLNLGDATFGPLLAPSAFGRRTGVAAGDLDGDGNVDLVASGMAAYLGNGDGTLREVFRSSDPLDADRLLLADFDRDKRLDLLLAHLWDGFGQPPGRIGLRRGRGDGTFDDQVSYPTGAPVQEIATADVNGDGLPDALAFGLKSVTVLLGKEDGTLVTEALHRAGNLPGSLIVADLNADGISDLATANLFGKDVSVLLGRSDGGLGGPVSVPVGDQPTSIATDDLNGDGHADLVVANLVDGTIGVLLGRGDGTFLSQTTIPAPSGLNTILIGDVDDDGIPDLLVDNLGTGTRRLLFGRGDGTFRQALPLLLPSSPLLLADVDGDGTLDVVTTLGISLGNGDGTFRPSTTILVDAAVLGDFDEDGTTDLVGAKGASLRITRGPVVDGGSQAIAGGTQDTVASMVVADFNGDGHLDIAKSFRVEPTVELLFGNGHGDFQSPRRYPVSEAGGKLSAGDLDGDGRMDLVITTSTSNVGVLLNTGCY